MGAASEMKEASIKRGRRRESERAAARFVSNRAAVAGLVVLVASVTATL